jgi:ATP-dependent 26S proteasome regulatory subunit
MNFFMGRHFLDNKACHNRQEAVNPDNIDVRFEDIGGLEDEKRRLREIVILPFTRPELFSRGKLLRPPKGVLLYGPPGTGKTMVRAIMDLRNGNFFLSCTNHMFSHMQREFF